MSDRYGSFDTHIGILYDFLCHMAYVTNCHKMPFYDIKYGNMDIKRTVSIRQIDLLGSEPLESKKIKQKMQKTEISIFPMYFWANSFVKKKVK